MRRAKLAVLAVAEAVAAAEVPVVPAIARGVAEAAVVKPQVAAKQQVAAVAAAGVEPLSWTLSVRSRVQHPE